MSGGKTFFFKLLGTKQLPTFVGGVCLTDFSVLSQIKSSSEIEIIVIKDVKFIEVSFSKIINL